MHQDTGVPPRAHAIVAWLVAVVSVATMISHSWVPLDEGTTLLAARWVEGGALPHRDFAYPYTGGLAALHALTVRLVGDSMLAPRLNLLAAFALWLPAVWFLARRFTTPVVAALMTVACAWWSILVYPAAMPTWYLLFCATWGAAALAKWYDTGALWWVLIAGLAAGVAIAIKQTGVGTLVGAGFGVLAIHQSRVSPERGATGQQDRSLLTIALLAVAGVVPLAIAVKRGLLSGEALAIALPLASVILALGLREWHRQVSEGGPTAGATQASAGGETSRLFGAWAVLVIGAAVPVLALMAWYATNGALDALLAGNTGGIVRTAATIDRPMSTAATMLGFGLVAWALIGGAAFTARRLATRRAVSAVAIVTAATALLAAAEFTPAYRAVWFGAQLVIPAAVVLIAKSRSAPGTDPIPLVLAAAAVLLAINQVPYGAPNYFAYVAPLGFLVALAALPSASATDDGAGHRRGVVVVLLVLTAFGGWFHRIGSVHSVGFGPVWWDDAHALPGAHGKLLVTAADSAEYSRLTQLVAEHGGSERFAAGPELGALYALAGTQRVVAQPYLLTDDADGDSTAVAAALDPSAIDAVALNDDPRFLPAVSASARAWIVARYPNAERVGRVEFRWR